MDSVLRMSSLQFPGLSEIKNWMPKSCWIPYPWKPLPWDSRKTGKLYFNILGDYPEVKTKKKKYEMVREHPFYNALQVKFAYAVTCHKAQGGQWDTVFVDQGYITRGNDQPGILPLALHRRNPGDKEIVPGKFQR